MDPLEEVQTGFLLSLVAAAAAAASKATRWAEVPDYAVPAVLPQKNEETGALRRSVTAWAREQGNPILLREMHCV
ncbi:hypothetical protein CPLU01_09587 [Colletotrichum plurivorum]|uniref:Uncharacterized protein n=1 Tax=Colletotrichum plurivorum TaxID=2175906 RepID=A0A8H6K876_9PEZI|nr:hypothetical protein CPLU01_09587 [Colletotrichum plurivorum]